MSSSISGNLFYQGRFQAATLKSEAALITEIIPQAHTDTTNLIVPGFVDLQIYGADHCLFSADASVERLSFIEQSLLKQGTTAFLICLATNTPEVFKHCIEVVKAHRKEAKNCMGLHLEGPFINPEKRGAHVEAFIRKAELEELKRLIDFGDGCIKMMTLAPELQADEVIDYLLQQGIVLSLGHSMATFQQATKAYNQGVQSTTHLFNAMTAIQHRAPGIPTAVFNHPKAMASIIPDGLHVDFEVVKMAHMLLKERLFFITDAVAACAHGPYQHTLREGKFQMPDGTLSGSNISMLQALQNAVSHCGIALEEALDKLTLYPARLMGWEKQCGQLLVQSEANYLVLNPQLELKEVFFKGQPI